MSDGIKRRDFLKVLGAGGVGAALTGCSPQNVERLIPYVVAPEDITPGVATWYTTVCDGCAAQCGMWVRTREGRVVKVEGNPHHPVSGGALCAKGHATLQHLYNPDRYPGPMVRENGVLRAATWEEAEALLAQKLQGASGGVLFLSGTLGPTLSALADAFVGVLGGRRVEYHALSDAPLREAMRLAFGADRLPRYDMSSARFLVSFGNDFLESGPSPVEHQRGFARMSAVDGHGAKGRFIYAGPRLSLTGLNADEWIPIRPGSEAALALAMAATIADGGARTGPWAQLLSSVDLGTAARTTGVGEETIRDLARRFVSEGPSLALGPGVGAHHRNATAAHLSVLVLNQVAGSVGRTLYLEGGPEGATRPYSEMEGAIAAMARGQVGVVLIHGTNPAYSLPPSSQFKEALAKVGFKVSFASAPDETSALADLVLPDRHFLESWGDSSPRPGLMALRQPVMQAVPHFDAKQTGDVLLSVASRLGHSLGAATFYEYLRAAHQAMLGADPSGFEAVWRASLRRGIAEYPPVAPSPPAALRAPAQSLSLEVPALDGEGEFALLVYPSPRFGAGEFANAPWMLELPDPVSKIAWHSWVEMHPAAAQARGIREGDIVTVASPHGSIEVPVWLYPGIRDDVVAVAMGGGHTDFGRWGTGKGANPMLLLPAAPEDGSGAFVTLATRVTVTPTGRRQRLVTTEGSESQHGRPIAPAVALAALRHGGGGHGDKGGHGPLKELQGLGGFVPVDAEGGRPEAFPLEGSRYGQYAGAEAKARWGLAIDLDKCTGCSACVTACQAENNIPWVGEDQVLIGRELHWLRVERYYEHVDATRASHLDVRFLPMMCQHCGNAPCEPVCPVYATYHTPEGVNAQVYNRCVGTRYCANNCPYKVRVFNWYRYTDENVPEPMNWQFNPDVTVRSNGVMEKCSLCMQRIRDAEHKSVMEGRGKIPGDGEIVTACQQSCPAEAIVFGNLRDPSSRIAQLVRDERTYRVLDVILNTQPGVNYLKKVMFHEVASGEHP